MMSRNRRYCFTINNPIITKEDLLEKIKKYASTEFCIIGYEIGEIEKTPHLQGYVRFTNALDFDTIRVNLFENKAHIEIAREDDLKNFEYCSKDKDYITFGDARYSNKNGVDSGIIDDILNDMPLKELCKKYYYYVLYHYRDFKKLYDDLKKERYLENCNIDLEF